MSAVTVVYNTLYIEKCGMCISICNKYAVDHVCFFAFCKQIRDLLRVEKNGTYCIRVRGHSINVMHINMTAALSESTEEMS